MTSYRVNEIFRSIQGEGARAGTSNVFIRFSGCNMECRKESGDRSPGGFDCDTEFVSGVPMSAIDILNAMGVAQGHSNNRWCVLTGGEPLLQFDEELSDTLRSEGWSIAIETNGTLAVPPHAMVDWIACSPKVAEHAIVLPRADELRYVRHAGQGIPRPRLTSASALYLSPAWGADGVDRAALATCMELVHANPEWRLSMQMHKYASIR